MKPLQSIKLIILVAIVGITAIFSCRTTKNIDTSQQRVDSTVEAVKKHYEEILRDSTVKWQKAISDLRKTVATFVPVKCPDVIIPESCPRDSLVKIILQQQDKMKSMQNEFRTNADGSFYLKGQLESVSYDFEQKASEFNEINAKYAALKIDNDSTKSRLQKELDSKKKEVHRSGGFGAWWWLLIIGFIGGLAVAYRKQIFNKVKP